MAQTSPSELTGSHRTIPPANFDRVVVVGTTGSGKSTYSRELADRLRTRCVELDALYWGQEWTPRNDFEQQVLHAVQEPRWVIDGNYSIVRDIVWRRATAIFWLDYSFLRIFSQAFRRTVRRVVLQERLYGDNRETLHGTLFDIDTPLWLVTRTFRRRRREYSLLFGRPEYSDVTVVRLQAPAAAHGFLSEVERDSEAIRRGCPPA
jgi:adenylate kinase family enzyme